MNPKPLLFYSLGAFAVLLALAWPSPSQGDSGPESPLQNALLLEINLQQSRIADNQTLIDEKLALIGEDLRIARIFATRGGGGKAK